MYMFKGIYTNVVSRVDISNVTEYFESFLIEEQLTSQYLIIINYTKGTFAVFRTRTIFYKFYTCTKYIYKKPPYIRV